MTRRIRPGFKEADSKTTQNPFLPGAIEFFGDKCLLILLFGKGENSRVFYRPFTKII